MKHTQGEWTFSPMKGEPGHCFVAQVWDVEGNSLATVDSRYGEEESTAIAKLIASAPELLKALELIAAWKMPPTGQFWDKEEKEPMSYGACYGSNGERDYIISIARKAIQKSTS